MTSPAKFSLPLLGAIALTLCLPAAAADSVAPPAPTARKVAIDNSGTQALGAPTSDLVYTPVTPCRILDTRRTANGPIAADGTRDFKVFGVSSFANQGGSASDCGITPLAASAIAINLTTVGPAAPGYAIAFQFGSSQPLAASINYRAGAVTNNSLIVRTPNPTLNIDFTLYTFAQAHFVADIVGYFTPPVATAMQCTSTPESNLAVVAGGQGTTVAPDCPVGYATTGTNCRSDHTTMSLVGKTSGTCQARNNGNSASALRASRSCCRVPGR